MPLSEAAALVARLGLRPHPEGGHYRETVRLPAAGGGRSAMTAILFLLDAGERSHWHRVDAAELWMWHAGTPLGLRVVDTGGVVLEHRLGPEAPQALVPAHAWQAAEAASGWALVGCVVTPGFDFAGFELAPPGWAPG